MADTGASTAVYSAAAAGSTGVGTGSGRPLRRAGSLQYDPQDPWDSVAAAAAAAGGGRGSFNDLYVKSRQGMVIEVSSL